MSGLCPPSPQVDDSHTVKELINTVAEKIGERHDMLTNACMQMYACMQWLPHSVSNTDRPRCIVMRVVRRDQAGYVQYSMYIFYSVRTYKGLLLVAL